MDNFFASLVQLGLLIVGVVLDAVLTVDAVPPW
jgi:hypothetical protein